jgi:hypothetical protein
MLTSIGLLHEWRLQPTCRVVTVAQVVLPDAVGNTRIVSVARAATAKASTKVGGVPQLQVNRNDKSFSLKVLCATVHMVRQVVVTVTIFACDGATRRGTTQHVLTLQIMFCTCTSYNLHQDYEKKEQEA